LYSPHLDAYYVGLTSDLNSRSYYHNSGYENYTSKGVPWKLVWSTSKPSRALAFRLEKKIKNLSKERKRRFIKKYSNEDSSPDDHMIVMSGC
jgi:putative endonuclease